MNIGKLGKWAVIGMAIASGIGAAATSIVSDRQAKASEELIAQNKLLIDKVNTLIEKKD